MSSATSTATGCSARACRKIEGYAITDAATQELKPWPEIGGRGLYCHFSGNVHMDAVIMEIPPGKALTPGKHMYEQLIYV